MKRWKISNWRMCVKEQTIKKVNMIKIHLFVVWLFALITCIIHTWGFEAWKNYPFFALTFNAKSIFQMLILAGEKKEQQKIVQKNLVVCGLDELHKYKSQVRSKDGHNRMKSLVPLPRGAWSFEEK